MLRTLNRMLRQQRQPHPPVQGTSAQPERARPAFHQALEILGPAGLTVVDVGARWGAGDAGSVSSLWPG